MSRYVIKTKTGRSYWNQLKGWGPKEDATIFHDSPPNHVPGGEAVKLPWVAQIWKVFEDGSDRDDYCVKEFAPGEVSDDYIRGYLGGMIDGDERMMGDPYHDFEIRWATNYRIDL